MVSYRIKVVPPKEYLEKYLIYCPVTGEFFWKPRNRDEFTAHRFFKVWNTRYAWQPAGNWLKNKHSPFYRLEIQINKVRFLAHRLAIVMSGSDPDCLIGMEVDHIDGNSENNKISNLRVVSKRQNATNRFDTGRNKNGHTGIKRSKREKKWVARIGFCGKTISLGYFDDIEDAIAARERAKLAYGYTKRHGNVLHQDSGS